MADQSHVSGGERGGDRWPQLKVMIKIDLFPKPMSWMERIEQLGLENGCVDPRLIKLAQQRQIASTHLSLREFTIYLVQATPMSRTAFVTHAGLAHNWLPWPFEYFLEFGLQWQARQLEQPIGYIGLQPVVYGGRACAPVLGKMIDEETQTEKRKLWLYDFDDGTAWRRDTLFGFVPFLAFVNKDQKRRVHDLTPSVTAKSRPPQL